MGMAAKKSPFFDTATTLGKIVAFFGVSAICGVLAAGLMIPVASFAGSGAKAAGEIFDALPANFKEAPISEPSKILSADGSTIATFYSENRQPVKLEDISPIMRKAIVSIEDERFYQHNGIDMRGITRAAVNNFTSSQQQGASTLTQQYVNNLLINSDVANGVDRSELTISGTKDVADKAREAKLAISIEKEMSKDQILEGYLNLVLFSGRNYGIQSAAQRFYSVDAKDLNLQQSAMLAGMVQLPNAYNPDQYPERSLKRRNTVLAAMLRTGAIDQKAYDTAVKSDLGLKPNIVKSGCISAEENAYFCDYVTRLITTDSAYGKTKKDRENLLYRGGLVIKTTLNASLNRKAAKDARKTVNPTAASNTDVFSSLVSVEPGTGNILTMAQNTNYDPEKKLGNTVLNFAVESAMGGAGGFQGGSTMKPYTTLAWLHEGHHMYDTINARKQTFMPNDPWKASCLPGGVARIGGPWEPKNASKGFYRPMTVDTGLYWSINSATIQEAKKLDLCNISDYINKLGVKDQEGGEGLTPADFTPKAPSFIIGSSKITPLSQAAAFAAFANNGEYCEPRALVSVKDMEGNNYKVKSETCNQAVDPTYVADLNGTLKKIATNRVSKGRVAGPIAGKTGTNNWSTSTWFVGYSTGISTASWVGRLHSQAAEKQNTLQSSLINNKRAPFALDSSTYAAPLWVNFMEEAVMQYDRKSFGSARSAPKKAETKSDSSSNDSSNSADQASNKSDNKSKTDSKTKSDTKSTAKDKPKSDTKSSTKDKPATEKKAPAKKEPAAPSKNGG